jgi:hypothetical protein
MWWVAQGLNPGALNSKQADLCASTLHSSWQAHELAVLEDGGPVFGLTIEEVTERCRSDVQLSCMRVVLSSGGLL